MGNFEPTEPANKVIEFELQKKPQVAQTVFLACPAHPPIEPLNSRHGFTLVSEQTAFHG
jgi:hypothetical protein